MITGGLESVGEAVTGGLAARAVEPAAGEGGSGGHGACLNCNTALTGPHCHRCGQAAHVHRTLTAFWHDLAHSVLHFDGKLWRTLPLLALRPGELTRRYVAGQRASFVSPMALFLFSVFLMFAVFSTIGGPIGNGSSFEETQTPAEERAEARREFAQERAETVKELNGLRAERARLVAARQPTTEVDADIQRAEAELALKERLFNQALALIDSAEKREAEQAKADKEAVPGPARKAAEAAESDNLTVVAGADSLNEWFRKAYRKAKENPKLLAYKLQTSAYKFSWALIPISVPFLWLLFLHRRRYRQYKAYDHTVFITYSIAFMSLGVIALSLLRLLGVPEVIAGFAILLVPPAHMYRQLRGAYELSRWSALWRTFVLIVFAFIAGMLFFTLLLALGVLG
jgi:Skp family chaperone for outer membrane proteins